MKYKDIKKDLHSHSILYEYLHALKGVEEQTGRHIVF